jgi:hypothetical protein
VGFALILLFAAHAALAGGFPRSAQSAAISSAGAGIHARESAQMKRLMAISAAAIVTAGASAQNAVQWRVEDGGNGHWYRVRIYPQGVSWSESGIRANEAGAYLASLTSQAENAFVMSLVGSRGPWFAPGIYPDVLHGPWLGGRRANLQSNWSWITGEAWSFTAFCLNQPSGTACPQPELCLHIKLGAQCLPERGWGDLTETGQCLPELERLISSVEEWSADCNGDGVVDYGQIRSGQFADANANNIPDCCENGSSCCPGDTNNDGFVDGIDLATILTRWAQSATQFPNADCNRDGVIDGSDLSIVLGSWGVCP